MVMVDPGWDLWDLKRVRTTIWPSTDDWPDVDEALCQERFPAR